VLACQRMSNRLSPAASVRLRRRADARPRELGTRPGAQDAVPGPREGELGGSSERELAVPDGVP
jgi:hypothetical protein